MASFPILIKVKTWAIYETTVEADSLAAAIASGDNLPLTGLKVFRGPVARQTASQDKRASTIQAQKKAAK